MNYASKEIFEAVFGNVTPAEVIERAEAASVTPQDYVMTEIAEARKTGLETDVFEAFAACCEELGIAKS